MQLAYLDCFSGVAGDMFLAALLDAGLPISVIHDTLAKLGLPGVSVSAERVTRHALAATHLKVAIDASEQKAHRHLPQIVNIIRNADLPASAQTNAIRVFERLAQAEAKVHGSSIDKVHFHEVGAADAILDIVSACVGLHHLGVTRLVCSPIPTGSGVVKCAHGLMPVPAPAVAELLSGFPLASTDEQRELTTPTGAALVTTLADSFGPPPTMQLERVGVGAGGHEGVTRPNIMRVLLGRSANAPDHEEADTVVALEANLDDASGQIVAHTIQSALAAGALDAFATPITMKKGRPGCVLTLLVKPADAERLTTLLFAETPTFGVRSADHARRKLRREHVTADTPFGAIRVKLGRLGDNVVQAQPEFDDCAAASAAHHVALRRVQEAALDAWRRR